MEKKTNAMYFEELKTLVADPATAMTSEDRQDILDFLTRQLDSLEARKEAARVRAEKKRAESDALTDSIGALLGDEPMTIEDILVALDDENVTRNKVSARLGKLVKAGTAERISIKVEGSRKMAYCRADVGAVETTA